MTHGSLFSGIGGFNEGARLAGIPTKWDCEIEPFNRSILRKHNPNSIIYEDVRELHNPERVDIISGGFPCQDISKAGKGAGIEGQRSRLWFDFARIIRDLRPSYAIVENSPMLTSRGLDRILCDLAEIGYDAEWQCISNSEFGFPHDRERIYIVAYTPERRHPISLEEQGKIKGLFGQRSPDYARVSFLSERFYSIPEAESIRGDDGVPNWIQRVGALGNSVNPVVAHYLFDCIIRHASTK